jgi:signal transduction histidine kinase/putative methionine-R-sulfoxide reductase with GAF domain/ActR/RegA family two-component response regulator/HAMP domain-containing protein
MIDRFLRRLTVRRRVVGGFLVLVLLSALAIPLIVANHSFLANRLRQVADVEARAAHLLLLASMRIESSRVNLMRYMQDYAPSPYEALDDVDQAVQLLTEAQDLITSPDQKADVAVVLEALADYRTLIGDVEAARSEEEGLNVSRLLFQAYRFGNDIGQRIEQMVNDSEARVALANEAIYAEARSRLMFLVSGYVGLLVLALILASLVQRSITRPVTELREGAEAFRLGDIDITIPVVGTDDLSLLARAFNQMAAQLRDLISSLEQRVAERTAELERRALQLTTAAEVSRAASSILDLEELLSRTVELITDRFNLYYAGLFLVDEADEWAVLQAATGEAGRQMLAQSHRLEVGGVSMVGWCTANAQARIALDVGEEAVRFDNPLLPDTHSEMALPLISRGRVMGALDVQSTREAAFTDEDVTVLQTMADQLANAIENARLFQQTQESLEEISRLHQRYLEQEWQEYLAAKEARARAGYLYDRGTVRPASDVWAPEIALVAQRGETVALSEMAAALQESVDAVGASLRQAHPERSRRAQDAAPQTAPAQSALAVPLKLRGQMIGALDFYETEQSRQWSSDDIALVEAVAEQAALAIENARLFEEIQRRVQDLGMLFDASQDLASALLWPEKIAEVVARHFVETMGDLECSLSLFDPQESGTLQVLADLYVEKDEDGINVIGRGEGKETIHLSDYPATARVVETLQPLVVQASDPDADPAELAYMQDFEVATLVIFPLAIKGQAIGIMELEAWQERHFTPEELNLAMTLANQAAVALENARLYQEAMETTERLAEMDRLKTQFLANMSHELRTPLNTIIGFSRVILKGIDGSITEQQRVDLTSIYNNGQHLLGLINDILDISRIEAGKLELIFEPVDLHHIIDGVMSTAVALVRDKPIKLEQEVDPELPTVRADGTRVRQVILNLLANAAKFTEKGQITLRANANEEHVTISVHDTGIGISPEDQATLFQEFSQVDASATRRAGGAGLGLAISRHLVEMHSGRIWVESEPGVGSTFTFTLPVAGPEAERVEESKALAGLTISPDRKLILAVEDDGGVITLYKRYLEKHGYQIVGLGEGEQAVRWARELSPYAIILDVLLPDKDGWAVLEELKSSRETRQIPLIVCTIVSDGEARALSIGAADYLVKPILEEDLLHSLERLEERQPESQF